MNLKGIFHISVVLEHTSLVYFESPLVRLFASSPAALGFSGLQMVLQSNAEQEAMDIPFLCLVAVCIMVMEVVGVQLFNDCRVATRYGQTWQLPAGAVARLPGTILLQTDFQLVLVGLLAGMVPVIVV